MGKIIHNAKLKRQRRTRAKIVGPSQYPRLSIFRSNKFIYAQLIDDVKQITLAEANDAKVVGKMTKKERSAKVGTDVATKILALGIKKVVFDRGSYKYSGRVQAVADSARAAGLEI